MRQETKIRGLFIKASFSPRRIAPYSQVKCEDEVIYEMIKPNLSTLDLV